MTIKNHRVVSLRTFCIVIVYYVTLITSSPVNSSKDDLSTLKLVQIISRHGDREPDKSADGVGRLTNLGKKQMYDWGQLIRQRYDGFIPLNFDPEQVSFISSDKDRTIQSASLVAYGLFKEFNQKATWSQPEKIPFEPIPIRTIPGEVDRVLRNTDDCPRRVEFKNKSMIDISKMYSEDHSDLIQYYLEHTGQDPEVDTNAIWFSQFIIQQDELYYNRSHNLTMPDWAVPLFENDAYLRINTAPARYMMGQSMEYRRLYSGPLIKILSENMDQKIEGVEQRFVFFSGHDRNLLGLLICFGLDDPENKPEMPGKGAALIMELHQDGDKGEFYVKFYFRIDLQSDLELMDLPECPAPCTIENFKRITRDLIPLDFEKECNPAVNLKSSFATNSADGEGFKRYGWEFFVGFGTTTIIIVSALSVLTIYSRVKKVRGITYQNL